ncbi:retrovirus-related pol polyprotein from transposon TNT 1-94 [Tanacetum coccineum]
MTHPHPKRNFVPRAVLMKYGLRTLNIARQNSSRVAVSINTSKPINIAYPKPIVNCARTTSNVFNRSHSHVRRPFNMFTSNKNNHFKEKVNTVKGNVTTAGPKAVVSDKKGNEANTVKASMTGNKSYLSDYEEIDGGFVAFRGDPKGGKITGKDTECVVLSPDFKLLDENHVLLRVPRKDNMYNVDLKNIVPSGGIENLIDLKVKVIRCDNGTEFKNKVMNQFCEMKGIKECKNAGKARVETVPGKDHILLLILTQDLSFSSSSKDSTDAGFKPSGEEEKKDAKDPENEDSEVPNTEELRVNQEQDANVNSTNNINTVSLTVNAANIENNVVNENIVYGHVDDPNMPNLEEIVYSDDNEDVNAEADMTNLDTYIIVSPTPTTKIQKDHLLE